MSAPDVVADLRSDTITHPTPAMYEAMRDAVLGDDVLDEDPTVHALEREAAKLLGKEASLFVPSGTMANTIAIAVSTRPGDEIVLMEDAHTYLYEAGGSARLWGVHPWPLKTEGGCPTPEQVERAIRSEDPHHPRTSLVLLENTHNMQGGVVVPPERIAAVAAVCREHDLALHMDGARLFNAVAATGREAVEFTQHVDTVSCCLSKGLSCPVGSVLAGTEAAIAEARRVRKLLGGGMRQAGILAACGRVALAESIDRLGEDHRLARKLGAGLASLDGLTVFPDPPQSNIVMARLPGDDRRRHLHWSEALARRGVLAFDIGDSCVRFVTHRHLDEPALDAAIEACKETYAEFCGS